MHDDGVDRIAQLVDWHASTARHVEQQRATLLASAEKHRDAAQVAVFTGDEVTVARHLKAALGDEEAAAALLSPQRPLPVREE